MPAHHAWDGDKHRHARTNATCLVASLVPGTGLAPQRGAPRASVQLLTLWTLKKVIFIEKSYKKAPAPTHYLGYSCPSHRDRIPESSHTARVLRITRFGAGNPAQLELGCSESENMTL